MRISRVVLSLVVPAVLGSPAWTQEPLLSAVCTMEGENQQVQLVTKLGSADRVASLAMPELSSPGLVWEHVDGGFHWVPFSVSIGDHGYQVFTVCNFTGGSLPIVGAQLLSSFDGNPPVPVWQDTAIEGHQGGAVASADANDTLVLLEGVPNGAPPPFNFRPRLRKYHSGSATPDWSYTFPPANAGAWTRLAISRDGQTIVVAASEPQSAAYTYDIVVFTASSPTPVSFTKITSGNAQFFKGWDLSADGSTLYYSTINDQYAHVFDVASHSEVFTTHIASGLDGHGISGDGSLFAYGRKTPAGKWAVYLWEKQSGTYVNTFVQEANIPGDYCPHGIDVSDDGSTVVSGWTNISTYKSDHVEALDVATQTVTMSATQVGTSTLQNIIVQVQSSADGSYFAVASWGDGPGPLEECRVFSRDSDTAVASVNSPGSAWVCSMSADGDRAAFGTSDGPASLGFGGGAVELLTTGNEDLLLHGTPHVGATVSLDVDLPAGAGAFLLVSLAGLDPPHVFPAAGTLYVDPAALLLVALGAVPPSGTVSIPALIPLDPVLVGVAPVIQGFSTPPKHLSSDWVKMRILP